MTISKEIFCHHCGKKIKFYRTQYGKGYYAHPIYTFNGRTVKDGNERADQGCAGEPRRWATPMRRGKAVW